MLDVEHMKDITAKALEYFAFKKLRNRQDVGGVKGVKGVYFNTGLFPGIPPYSRLSLCAHTKVGTCLPSQSP